MSYTLLSKTHPSARKQHRCIWCGEAILKGDKYFHEKSIYDGGFQNHKWHPECWSDSQKFFLEFGEEEFSAYDNERPISPANTSNDPTSCPR